MGIRGFRLALVAALAFAAPAVNGYNNTTGGPISGYSGRPGDFSCTASCHTTTGGYTGSISWGGATTVQTSSSNNAFSMTFTTNAPRAGFNLAAYYVSGAANVGGLGTLDADVQATGTDELAHNAPTAPSGGSVAWSFNWDAPATAGTYRFYACANPVNNDNSTTGDGNQVCSTRTITVNGQPVISAIANQTINEDGNTGALAFTITDADSASFTPSGSSDDTTLVPNANIVFGGSGTNRTVTITPAANRSGTATITVTVSDGEGGSDTETLFLTVNPVNDAPTITAIADQAAINEDASQQTVNFSGIGDGSTLESDTLTVTATSSNTAVIPHPAVTYTSPNTTGSLAYTPVANANGTATITVTVTDSGGTSNGGDNTTTETFLVTVNSVNDAPTITPIADPAAINEDATQQTVMFSGIGDGSTLETETLSVTATSSNTAVIPNPTVTYTSPNATGSLAYTPVANANGSAVITVTVMDSGGTANGGDNSTSDTFTVTVNAQNDAPVAGDDTPGVSKNSSNNELDVLANDTDIDAGDTETIISVGTPSNGGSVVIGGACAANTLCYTPATNFSGNETFTYTMRDTALASDTATVTVTVASGVAPVGVNDSITVLEDSSANVIDVLANDTDGDVGDTREVTEVNLSSSFPVATSSGSATLSAAAVDNAILYTPTANANGADSFTYTVRDAAGLTDVTPPTVSITITPVNDAPTLTAIGNPAAINEDAGLQTVSLAGIGTGAANETQTLTVTASSSNTGLIPNPAVSYTSPNAAGSLSYTPVGNASGSAVITVTVTDDGGTADGGANSFQRTFTVTVNPVNDAPVLNAIPNPAAIDEDAGVQSVNLAGIGAGGGEGQTLTVTATSNNTALIPNPTATYTSPNTSGSLAYAPVADANGSAVITVTVTDDGGTANGGVNTFSRNFTVTVNGVNDSPVVAAIPQQQINDAELYSHTISVADADGETSFTYSLTGAPAGMSIDGNGTITWTPPIGTSGIFTPTARATDGSGATGTRQFAVDVSAPDSDGDGMPDSFENLHGLDPNDSSDAAGDADGDGVTNLAEYQQGLDPTLDDVAPILAIPADLVVPSTGYLTLVDLGASTAVDGLDGELTPTADLDSTALRPGRYLVTWTASDAAGNIATDIQQVDVLPTVDIGGTWIAAEGGGGLLQVDLNGTPPEYPVQIPYTVSGTAGAADTDVVAGTLTIASGLSTYLFFDVTDDGVSEGNETLTVTLGDPVQATPGIRRSHDVTIAEGNVPPSVYLSGNQGGVSSLMAFQDDLYTLSATAFDVNPIATLTYDWSGSDDALGIDAFTTATAMFDPAALAEGAYVARVTVGDGDGGSAEAMLLLRVVAGSAPAGDQDLDGILDDVDSEIFYRAVMENQTGDPASAELLETESQLLGLRRGRTSIAAGRTGALITMGDIVNFGVGEGALPLIGADSYENVGGIFDFEIHFVIPGGTARVVLPLQTAIRQGSVYRKFDPVAGWHDFVVDADNAVASAFSTLGRCPGPASSEYVDGLQPFADCVRLTLRDGGPNDADGVADRVIRDPGGVAIAAPAADGETAAVSSGAFLALWLPLALLLRLRCRLGAALLALAALCVAAPAQAEHHVRIHYSGDIASGFDSNVTNAQQDADIRESGFASASGTVDYQRALSLYTTLLLRGSAQGEYWNSFDGLNNGKGTAMARLLYRGDGDFWTPTFAGWVSAAVLEFDSAIRDSNEYRAGAFVTENLSTQVTGRLSLAASRRESDGLVYDLSGYSASLNFDWVPAPRTVVYTGYQYYVGDVASTASADSFWIVEAADAIEADDAFGGLDGGLLAYRLDAKAQIATLGFNYAFSRKLSADVQGQYISTRATSRIDYERMVGVVSLLARF